MKLLNFGHPLTTEQVQEVEQLLGQNITIISVPIRVDIDHPIQPQIEPLINAISDSINLHLEPYVINLPGFSSAAAVILAILHGRSGYFPSILVIRRVPNAIPPRFTVSEILNLQSIRQESRHVRNH